jgi:hypothetical protein
MSYRELLLGCGYRRNRIIDPYAPVSPANGCRVDEALRWQQVLRVDLNPDCQPDYVMDIEKGLTTYGAPPANHWCTPFFFPEPSSWGGHARYRLMEDSFHEVHAYEVLEHLGQQGDATSFFATFDDIWRVLVPEGWLCATVPSRYSQWLWGDPGHRRVIYPASLVFLNRPQYDKQLGRTASSDYRSMFVGDWDIVYSHDNEETHSFVLQAVKPPRSPK